MVHAAANKLHLKQFMLLVLSAILVVTFLIPFKAFAQQGTDITATICAAEGPILQITSPKSDSVVNSREVPLIGTAQRTSQIEVYVNEEYIQSTAVGADNLINTTIPLVLGTNTIKLVAYYSCNQQNYETNLVVTYTPDASSQTGRPSTRTTRPGNTAPNQVSNPEDETEAKPGIIDRIEDNFNFSRNTSFVRPLFSWISLFISAFGLALFLRPKTFRQLFGKATKNKNHLYMMSQYRLIRLVGILLFLIFGILILI